MKKVKFVLIMMFFSLSGFSQSINELENEIVALNEQIQVLERQKILGQNFAEKERHRVQAEIEKLEQLFDNTKKEIEFKSKNLDELKVLDEKYRSLEKSVSDKIEQKEKEINNFDSSESDKFIISGYSLLASSIIFMGAGSGLISGAVSANDRYEKALLNFNQTEADKNFKIIKPMEVGGYLCFGISLGSFASSVALLFKGYDKRSGKTDLEKEKKVLENEMNTLNEEKVLEKKNIIDSFLEAENKKLRIIQEKLNSKRVELDNLNSNSNVAIDEKISKLKQKISQIQNNIEFMRLLEE